MISFRCICNEILEVPTELAGDAVQCPACRRLIDVPTAGNLGSLLDDGTVKMGDAHVVRPNLGDKLIAYGGQADMRPAIDEVLLAGETPQQPAHRAVPRYDPVTGELIVPVEIADDELPPAPKIDPNAAVLGYARSVPQAAKKGSRPEAIQWWGLPWQLFGGLNWMAMLAVYVAHVILYLPMLMPGFMILWLPLTLGLTLVVTSHYANTMEEFGPNAMDRVPILLRNADFGEDVLRPLYNIGVAGVLSFFPLIAIAMFGPVHVFRDHEWVLYSLTAWGMLLFPLAAFTMICGGTLHNLWPHRMVSAVGVAPAKLVLGMVAFWLAMAAYVVSWSFFEFTGIGAFSATMPTMGEFIKYLAGIGFTLGGFAVAVYLMHLAAGWLGLIYRDHHQDLNWALQRNDRVYGADRMADVMRQRKPVVDTLDPRRSQIDTRNAKPALPLQQHNGFEVKI